ncbi:hypothetical protein [Micromonospora sp. DT229]|uniref:hypothetical protein n=1 Tax=Micromonospora sp. DT229 TaxID=3393430 RepID=UPI003CF9D82A
MRFNRLSGHATSRTGRHGGTIASRAGRHGGRTGSRAGRRGVLERRRGTVGRYGCCSVATR